jgi:hypothetical protein
MYRKGKDIRKKRHLAAFVVIPSVFGGSFLEMNFGFLNDIGRNFLLGSRKKLAKCIMRTFTCRSTFLYVWGVPVAASKMIVRFVIHVKIHE